jgi:hypothetical protein
LAERCLTSGLPQFGGNSFRRIVQTPGGVTIYYDVGHRLRPDGTALWRPERATITIPRRRDRRKRHPDPTKRFARRCNAPFHGRTLRWEDAKPILSTRAGLS